MPKIIPQDEFDVILEVASQFPHGASIRDFSEILKNKLSRRTLQRRLGRLVEQKKLTVSGEGRGRRYQVPENRIVANVVLPLQEVKATIENDIPISSGGKTVREAVRLPIFNRQPVGYNRSFLDAYRPNELFYLPEEIRHHLLELGQSAEEKQPVGTYVKQIFNRLLIDLSWNSSRLEGNTYSLLETERLLEQNESAEGKDAMEAQMILNHKAAIELLVDQADEIGSLLK